MNSNKEPVNNQNSTAAENDSNDLLAQAINDVGIYYSSVIKISDPSTGQVLLHMRGDE